MEACKRKWKEWFERSKNQKKSKGEKLR